MAQSEALKRAKKKYDLKTKGYHIKLIIGVDNDVIQTLDNCPNKIDLVRKAIRNYVQTNNQNRKN